MQPGGDGFNLGNAHGKVIIDPSGAIAGLNRAESEIQGFGQRIGGAFANIGGALSSLGGNLTTLTAPLAGVGAVGIRAAATFEDSMAEIEARTGLTGEALENIRQKALQLGADTQFSSQQSADAFLQLLTAGLSVDEAFASIDSILAGAAAAGADFGIVADQVTNILASMSLEAEQAGEVVQVLSNAAATSPASMTEMGEAMAIGGGVARQYGIELDELGAIFSIFANNNIRGSEAATQLRSMLLNMTRTTDGVRGAWLRLGTSLYDAEGNLRDLNTVFAEMDEALSTMSVQEQNDIITELAGSYGLVGFNAIRGSDGIAAVRDAMAEQADVMAVAERRMATFNGQITSLRGSIETLLITAFTPTIEALTPFVSQLIEAVNGVRAWVEVNPALTQQIIRIGAVVTGLGPALWAVGTALTAIGGIIAAVLSPVGLLIGAITAIGIAYRNNLGGFADFVDTTFVPAFNRLRTVISDFSSAIGNGAGLFDALRFTFWDATWIDTVENTAHIVIDALAPMFREIGTFVMNNLQPIANAIRTIMNVIALTNPLGQFLTVLRLLGIDALNIFQGLTGSITAFFSALNMGMSPITALELAILRVFGVQGQLAFIQLRTIAQNVFTTIQNAVQQVIPFVQSLISGLGSTIVGMWQTIQPSLTAFADYFMSRVMPPVMEIIRSVMGLISAMAQTIVDLWQVVSPHLTSFANWFMKDALPAIADFILDTVMPAISDFIDVLTRVWTDVSPMLVQFADWFLTTILPEILAFIKGTVLPAINNFIGLLQDIWNLVSPYLTNLYEWFINTGMPEIVSYIGGAVTNAFNNLIEIMSNIWNSVSAGITALRNNLETIFNWIMDNIIDPFIERIQSAINLFNEARNLQQLGGDLAGQVGQIANSGASPREIAGAFIRAIGNEARGSIPGASVGTNLIEQSGIARVHKGEAIVPAQFNPGYNPQAEGMGQGIRIDMLNVNANTYEAGQAAARGFADELDELFTRSGVNYSITGAR